MGVDAKEATGKVSGRTPHEMLRCKQQRLKGSVIGSERMDVIRAYRVFWPIRAVGGGEEHA